MVMSKEVVCAGLGLENSDKFHDECGLVGVWNHKEAANLAYLGLYAQQHRGQEGAGVVTLDSQTSPKLNVHRALGLVSDVFDGFDFARLPGPNAIGHVRYSTAGSSVLSNVQPFHAEINLGSMAVSHNGNLINADSLRAELIRSGAIFASTSDTEVFLHLLARAPRKVMGSSSILVEAVISALERVRGAYSLLILFEDRLFAIRDPNGFRPLSLGVLNGAVVVASETCAFDLIGAKYLRDVAPGEVVEIYREGELKSYFPLGVARYNPCIFEYIYFARPDSNVFGRNVYAVRKHLGHELAREHPARADYVISVPDSGTTAAIGYAEESGIPYEQGLIRNHYIGRTFIEPKQSIRDFGVKIKLNPNPELLKGKSVVVVDDSIVRGTTSKKLVKMLKEAGARELHLRISAPPTTGSCFYGIDTPCREDLIASRLDVAAIAEYLGADSLGYLSLEGLYRAVQRTPLLQAAGGPDSLEVTCGRFCDACFSGNYPIGTPSNYSKKQTEMF